MIDTATNKVVATVAVGAFPEGVAVTPDGKHVYVQNAGSNNVSVIDTATNTVVTMGGGANLILLSKTFRPWKIDQPLLLPASVQDFVGEDHLACFVVGLVIGKL